MTGVDVWMWNLRQGKLVGRPGATKHSLSQTWWMIVTLVLTAVQLDPLHLWLSVDQRSSCCCRVEA